MKQTFYKKEGRKYIAVSEYDSTLMDGLSYGDHLVSVYKGGSSRRKIDPAFATLIAAGRYAEDAMIKALQTASERRPQQTPITEGQRKAWKKLAKEFGDDLCTLQIASAHDIAEAGIRALQAEADMLYSNDAVRKAYEHFMLMCKLTKETL